MWHETFQIHIIHVTLFQSREVLGFLHVLADGHKSLQPTTKIIGNEII